MTNQWQSWDLNSDLSDYKHCTLNHRVFNNCEYHVVSLNSIEISSGDQIEVYQINKTETEIPELKPSLITNLVKFTSK